MRYVEIKLPGCLLVFTPSELQSLLAKDKRLWAEALRRGKGFKRAQAAQERAEKTPAKGVGYSGHGRKSGL